MVKPFVFLCGYVFYRRERGEKHHREQGVKVSYFSLCTLWLNLLYFFVVMFFTAENAEKKHRGAHSEKGILILEPFEKMLKRWFAVEVSDTTRDCAKTKNDLLRILCKKFFSGGYANVLTKGYSFCTVSRCLIDATRPVPKKIKTH